MNINKISILGCGWLGLPLGEFFVKSGFSVKGSTHNLEKINILKDAGIEPFLIDLSPSLNKDADKKFFDSDILIVCIPPKRRADIIEYHQNQMKSLIESIELGSIKKVLLVSSTSVYPNTNGHVDENCILPPAKDSGTALRIVENLFMQNDHFQTTILRFGGLIGYDRLPGRFLSGKKNLKNGSSPVNLIHRDDCIGIISLLLNKEYWGKIVNGVMPEHPTRKEFYTLAAEKEGFDVPIFEEEQSNQFKIIDSIVVGHVLPYSFKYSSPLHTLM
ncbi:MAG: NAD(P)H-binding protein [Prolixibacteraceae bacterium]|jgi:nucleoside-diphosphate-sugar epimerase|nr:NAD(P)H-binding protein [Prolixibacteraceae bacterium]